MSVNREHVQLLVDALRSGEYPQFRGALHKINDGFCCLGVACEVAIKHGLVVTKGQLDGSSDYITYDNDSACLPRSVVEWYGFEVANPWLITDDFAFPMAAAVVNDSMNKTFNEIADLFEGTFLS